MRAIVLSFVIFSPGRAQTNAMIKIYIDESGVRAGAEVLTVAAYAGRPKVWRTWTEDWRRSKRPIRIYHAADAANLRGEFSGWTAATRDELVSKLLPIIAEARVAGAVMALHLLEWPAPGS